MTRHQLLDMGAWTLVIFLFTATIWTLNVVLLWITLAVSLFVALVNVFIRKDRAGQANRR